MKQVFTPTRMAFVAALALGSAGLAAIGFHDATTAATVEVIVPIDLSPVARQGKVIFDAVCAECHGTNAAGTDQGPPLVHDIYNPGHHADIAFFHAAKFGVRRHHWPYGDMPAQPEVNDREIGAIVRYVRELQEANGIAARPHDM